MRIKDILTSDKRRNKLLWIKKNVKVIVWVVFFIAIYLNLNSGVLKPVGIDSEPNASGWVKFPFKPTNATVSGEYLYVLGGYHSVDSGGPDWGTTNSADTRFIGDSMGDLVITYQNGNTDTVPLIFGYTLWFQKHWQAGGAPFKTDQANTEMTRLLKKSLYLKDGFEGNNKCVLKIKIEKTPIKSISVVDNNKKAGTPTFDGAYISSNNSTEILKGGSVTVNTQDAFYQAHTIDSKNAYPQEVQNDIQQISHSLYMYESDYNNLPKFTYPSIYKGVKFSFSGSSLANIATGVVYNNMQNLVNRVDEDGFVHTSYKDAPGFSNGFGTWTPKASTFYDSFYSRDGSRAIMTLNAFGYTSKGEACVKFANKWMMYYPENNLTINDVKIPGHFSVIVNKPLIYSKELSKLGWPTRYTLKKFGADYENIGNQETDGHGLMMLANWNIYKNLGAEPKWVNENWKYLKEAADWIVWCFENPKISYASNGLLYAESEAGMNDYTLYCNIPCYLGLLRYADMAESIGNTSEATSWRECAEIIGQAISSKLFSGEKWNMSKSGFFHDPVITMMADVYGYDLSSMPETWVKYSINTYESDIAKVRKTGYFGAVGIGYDHSMITQNALLLDQMKDATKLVENLTKLSYSPKLPDPYIVPEGLMVDIENGIIRKQGDLGNLVQLSEAMKCYLLVAGVSPVTDSTLKIIPRLPDSWDFNINDFKVQNTSSLLNLSILYPKDGKQMANIALKNIKNLDSVKFRFGPFPLDTITVAAQIDGVQVGTELVDSGDSKWAWVSFTPDSKQENILSLVYSSTEQLPAWPIWPTVLTEPTIKAFSQNAVFIAAGAVCLIATLSAGVVLARKHHKKIK